MSMTNNIQIAEEESDAQESWTIEEIKNANSLSHFQKINESITSLTKIINGGIIIYTIFIFISKKFQMALPDISNITTQYAGSPVCAFNAMLLYALALGHDDYYSRTEKMLILSDYMGLQWIDFIIKVSLLFVSILQCMNIDLFIGICCYGYILTFIRALYLKIKLDKNHPLWEEVQMKWYPNNIKHNLVMLIWTVFYYIMLKEKYMYIFICYINKVQVDFQNPEVKKILLIINYSYIMIFDIYWAIRVSNKKIITKNKSFKAQYEKTLEEKVEKYYNNETH